MSSYNRLARPIAVIGSRAAYMHLCQHCKLDAHKNDVFAHVNDYQSACGRQFSRLLEIDGAEDVRDAKLIVSIVRRNIVNDTTANRSVKSTLEP